jgi:HD superfamily phosphohydrolase
LNRFLNNLDVIIQGMNEILFKHLLNDYQDAVRDPLWGNINVNPLLRKLMETQDFAKLTSIRQLGPTLHIYPGATHTRYNHSLGVYHIAKKLLLRVVQHESCPELTIRGVKSFLNAALLHDLGHFPYTHSLKELPLMDHEELSAKIILDGPLGKIIDQDRDNSSVMTAAIIDQGQDSAAFGKELLFYRHLLSGVLDPDKLDYLNRDAFFAAYPMVFRIRILFFLK